MQQKARLGKQRYSEYRGNPQSFPEGQQLGEEVGMEGQEELQRHRKQPGSNP